MRLIVILVAILVISTYGLSATIKVPGDYPTIQQAIDASIDGDVILVDPGTYSENINFKGKLITVKSVNGSANTIIDGNQVSSGVRFLNSEGSGSIIDGFSITNGIGFKSPDRKGGGIYCDNSSPTILNNIIYNNSVKGVGGGISCRNKSAPIIMNNIIIDNLSVAAGGGIYSSYSSPLIIKNIINNNSKIGTAIMSGGGIYITGSNTTTIVKDNVISNNISNRGGGIYCQGSTIISNNIICENKATDMGGGINCDKATATLNIYNNTIINNLANTGGGIQCWSESHPIFANTIFWNNSASVGKEIYLGPTTASLTISYSDIEGGKLSLYQESGCTLNWGAGMIDSNPLFVDESNGDYHITFPSPCKDTGYNAAVIGPADFEGDPRIAYGTVDMGADEFDTHLYYNGDAMPGGYVSLNFVGLPGTNPVALFIGIGVLDPPLASMWGEWYLKFPIMGPLVLAPIPSSGVEIISGPLPGTPPAPYSIPMQALIGTELTNLCIMNVE